MALHGRLFVQREGRVWQELTLDKPVLSIGRLPDNDLVLNSPQVERYHAEIRLEKEGPVLTDMGGRSGTSIGGRRLLPYQPHVLADHGAFRIGPYTIIYRSAEAAGPVRVSETDEPQEADQLQREQALSAD